MSNRDNQNKRDAGQTQQKENRENSQAEPEQGPEGKLQSNSPNSSAAGRRLAVFLWREGFTADELEVHIHVAADKWATEHLLEYCQ